MITLRKVGWQPLFIAARAICQLAVIGRWQQACRNWGRGYPPLFQLIQVESDEWGLIPQLLRNDVFFFYTWKKHRYLMYGYYICKRNAFLFIHCINVIQQKSTWSAKCEKRNIADRHPWLAKMYEYIPPPLFFTPKYPKPMISLKYVVPPLITTISQYVLSVSDFWAWLVGKSHVVDKSF